MRGITGLTKMWVIREKPEYTVEQTPGAWVIWGPCTNAECEAVGEECPSCGGAREKVVATCGFEKDSTMPSDPDMVHRVTGLEPWTPERIQ